MYPPPPKNIAKYVTPYGTGSHSGSSWSNAYSFREMIDNLASNTNYYLTDSVFTIDSILVSGLSNISFIGQGKNSTFIQGSVSSNVDPLDWSIKCFDLFDADNITIKDLQIRRFRGFGIRVGSASSFFYGYKLYIDSCGWAAFSSSDPPVQEIASPCGVKLFGDDGIFRKSNIMQSGWDGMQVAGYRVLIDTTTIYATGQDLPGAIHQGDGIGAFINPDSSYLVGTPPDTVRISKSGQFTVRKCNINTVVLRKSGIEAGPKDPDKHTEKPLVQVYNSIVMGGKGIGITQDANPRIGNFYSTIVDCKVSDLDFERYPIRIDYWDAGTPGEIKNVQLFCPLNYGNDCPVGEYYTEEQAVTYSGTNRFWIGVIEYTFCVDNHPFQ